MSTLEAVGMDSLVSTDWLDRHLGEPVLVVLDCSVHTDIEANGRPRDTSGRAEYERGHIPTAGFADLTKELSESDARIEFALPAPERFCAAMAALHAGDRDARTITYCGGGILASSNAFVMTRLGYTDVGVYTASLQEWAADPDNPMAVGSA